MNPALWEGVGFVVCGLNGYALHRVRKIKGGWFWVESNPLKQHWCAPLGPQEAPAHDRYLTPLVPQRSCCDGRAGIRD
jgi:hypothetical protein